MKTHLGPVVRAERALFQVDMRPGRDVDGGVACFFDDRIECDWRCGQTDSFAIYRRSPAMILSVDIPKKIFIVCIDRFSIELDVKIMGLELTREQIVTWMRK